MQNNKQFYAIMQKNKQRILKVCPDATEESGIYVMTREENGFKYAYVGQAKHLLLRLAQHLSGYQHIDLSIKKHGLYSANKQTGWKIMCIEFPLSQLDDMEQRYIKQCARAGYQLRNKTSGGQGEGKFAIDETERKGYRKGVEYGYNKARKEVKHWFDLHLNYAVKKEGNKVQEKAKKKFEEFMEYDN